MWSGYEWNIKAGIGLGPGPNNWNDDTESVYVDNQGNLHLKMIYLNNKWYCAEISSVNEFGYGTFTFNTRSTLDLDPNAVFGMFIYSDDCHEIDIEYSKWGNFLNNTNASFTVQPQNACCVNSPCNPTYIDNINIHRFNAQLNQESLNSFSWSPTTVEFKNTSPTLTTKWNPPLNTYIPRYPTLLPTHVHLNLWLFQGNPPQSNLQQEIIIQSFQFLPLTNETICPPDKINILGNCASRNLIALGGLGIFVLILLTKSNQSS